MPTPKERNRGQFTNSILNNEILEINVESGRVPNLAFRGAIGAVRLGRTCGVQLKS